MPHVIGKGRYGRATYPERSSFGGTQGPTGATGPSGSGGVTGGFGIRVDVTDPILPIVNLIPPGSPGDVLQLDGSSTPVWGPVPTALTIESFSTPTTLLEVGQSLVNPTFSASYNQLPDSATLTDNAGNPPIALVSPFTAVTSPHTFTKTTIGQSVTWTDTATKSGAGTAAASVSASWGALNYYGAANDPGVITEAFVESLTTSVLSTSRIISNFTQTVSGEEYLWYCYPTSEGVAILYDNSTGFQIDTTVETTTLVVTNSFGVTVNYTVMRSTFQINSTITVRVT
jgi:hypothetical protein